MNGNLNNKNGIIISVDFDGTCVSHEFPNIGKDIGGEKHWTKKKKFSEESKKKMSESQKKLYQNGYIHPRKGIKETVGGSKKRSHKYLCRCGKCRFGKTDTHSTNADR